MRGDNLHQRAQVNEYSPEDKPRTDSVDGWGFRRLVSDKWSPQGAWALQWCSHEAYLHGAPDSRIGSL